MTRAVQDGRRQGGLAAANDCDTSHHVALRRLETVCFERKVIGAELTFPGQTLRKGGTEDDAAVQDGRRCGSGTVQPRMIALQGFALNAQGSDERGR